MNHPPTTSGGETGYWSEDECAYVEDRGIGFGKCYVYDRSDTEVCVGILLWGKGVSLPGVVRPPQDVIDRGIRALAEWDTSRTALGLPPRRTRAERLDAAFESLRKEAT